MGTNQSRYSLPVDRMRGPPTSPSFDLKRSRHCFVHSIGRKVRCLRSDEKIGVLAFVAAIGDVDSNDGLGYGVERPE